MGELREQKPLVSVVIPTYSRPTFLARCIESVINQTYTNIEVIVVDDNNPNTVDRHDTEEVMRMFSNENKVVYLKHEHNKNGSAARNTGWKASHGKYITFIDDDDVILPEKIEKQVMCLEKLDSTWGACYTGYVLIKEKGDNQYSTESRSGDCYIDALMRTMFMGSGSNLFIRKSVVDDIGGYDESFQRNQDIEFMVRVLENNKLAYVDEPLLTIYQEGKRANRSFQQLDGYAKHYLNKFKGRIEKLNERDRIRVVSVISLERCRLAFYKGECRAGILILIENKVSVVYIARYLKYLVYRKISHKSYGFNGLN